MYTQQYYMRMFFIFNLLTHFMPSVSFYNPWKHKKQRFSEVFRGCRKRPVTWDGLTEMYFRERLVLQWILHAGTLLFNMFMSNKKQPKTFHGSSFYSISYTLWGFTVFITPLRGVIRLILLYFSLWQKKKEKGLPKTMNVSCEISTNCTF